MYPIFHLMFPFLLLNVFAHRLSTLTNSMHASKSLFFHSINFVMLVACAIIPFAMSINFALSRIKLILNFHILYNSCR